MPATASARPTTPDALKSVNNAVATTHHWQRLGGFCCKTYYWVAHRHSTPTWKRWHIAAIWWGNASVAHSRYDRERDARLKAPRAYGAPAWFVAAMPCLAVAEEYGPPGDPKGGYNTSAGYFGMISPPYAYPGGYGSSWLAIPYAAQIPIVYATWQASGSGAWPNTAPGCGL